MVSSLTSSRRRSLREVCLCEKRLACEWYDGGRSPAAVGPRRGRDVEVGAGRARRVRPAPLVRAVRQPTQGRAETTPTAEVPPAAKTLCPVEPCPWAAKYWVRAREPTPSAFEEDELADTAFDALCPLNRLRRY